MNRVLFQFGVLVMIYSFLAWLVLSSMNTFGITRRELASSLLLGFLLMIPESATQLRRFLTSKSPFED